MRLIIRLINLALVLFIINAGAVLADSSGGFNLRAGVGYDYISQEYFLETDSAYLNPDTSLKSALLKKDYLNNKKGFLFLGYISNPKIDGKFNQIYEVGWEQTEELFRILASGRVGKKWQKSQLEGNFRLELKENYKSTADPGEELTILNGYLDYRYQLSNMTNLRSRIYGERVIFDTVESYIYNYSRYGIELGFGLFTHDLNSISVTSAFEIRDVPDSNQLDYGLLRGNLDYFGTVFGAYLTADFGLELRNYNQSNSRDDYLLLNFNSDFRIPLGRNFFLTTKQNVEYFNFSQDGFINDDYYLARLGVFTEHNLGRFSASFGPEIELLNIDSDYTNDDDYAEIMAVIGADYFGSGGLFFMIENKFGKRNYKNDSVYRSEFLFDRANLIGSARIFGDLNFDILLSFDIEFHDIQSDYSRLYLVSGGLSYHF